MIVRFRHKISRILLLALLLTSTALASNAPVSRAAENEGPTDYDWQAIYLVKLSLDITWPETVLSGDLRVINVCVIGNSPSFVRSLQNLVPKAGQKKLKINIRDDDSNDSVKGCNIAYISRGKNDYKQIIAAARKSPVLTMSPISGFTASGGGVEFVSTDVSDSNSLSNKVNVKFKINNNAAIENGLKIGTDALKSALEVTE